MKCDSNEKSQSIYTCLCHVGKATNPHAIQPLNSDVLHLQPNQPLNLKLFNLPNPLVPGHPPPPGGPAPGLTAIMIYSASTDRLALGWGAARPSHTQSQDWGPILTPGWLMCYTLGPETKPGWFMWYILCPEQNQAALCGTLWFPQKTQAGLCATLLVPKQNQAGLCGTLWVPKQNQAGLCGTLWVPKQNQAGLCATLWVPKQNQDS